MKIKSKKFGHTFNMNDRQYSNFIYSKVYDQGGKLKFLNSSKDYSIINESKISDTKFYLACVGMAVLTVASVLLHIQWNY